MRPFAGLLLLGLVSCATTPATPETKPVPFAEGMARPVFNSAQLIKGIYTPTAVAERIQGHLIIRCDVMASGEVRNCREIRPLPQLGPLMISRLESTQMEPSRREGVAISVSYVFNFIFRLPAPSDE